MNAKNYKNKRKEAKKILGGGGGAHDLTVLEGMEEANKRNKTRKFYTIARGAKAGLQPQASVSKDGDNNLTGNDRLIMGRWKQ